MEAGNPVRFGAFEVDLATGELRKGGNPVRLQEQPAKILAALLEHPGEVVRRDDLVKLLWPDGTFVDYDRGLNAAVNRLREALSDTAENPRYVETVPRRGYRFIAQVETTESRTGPESSPRARVPVPRRWIAVAGGLLVLVAGIWFWLSRRETHGPPLEPVPLTSFDGHEWSPSFSPDGTQVAFEWNGPKQDNTDIYVMTVGGGPPRRLTNSPVPEGRPAWSPDGRYIAFQRAREGILLVSPNGGAERRLFSSRSISGPNPWSADGKYVAFALPPAGGERAGIFAVAVEGGPARRLTSAEADTTHRAPAFSPDGRSLAFASCGGFHLCDLSVAPLAAGVGPVGPVRSVGKGGLIEFMAWTPDGETLVYSAFAMSAARLWRASLRGRAEPQLLTFAPPSSYAPGISRTGFRMAYAHSRRDTDIWTVENGGMTKGSINSTFSDSHAVFSPDGKKVAFSSDRTGNTEVWVANVDGSNLQQLTTSRASGSPRWSPDGRSIVYDTMIPDGSWDVSLVDAAGGSPVPIVRHPGDDAVPSFSHDGKWIYFSSGRAGRTEIYRVPVAGGEPVRLTDNGGWVARESADGESIYYTKENDRCGQPLFIRPIAGGPERQVINSICTRSFAETEQGIYYIGPTGGIAGIHLYDPATGKSRVVREMSRLVNFLSASPDGKKILAVVDSSTGADLYLVENFR